MTPDSDAAEGADVATLLGDDREAFEAVLEGDAPDPLAVVGDPFAGRTAVLDRAAERLGATRVRLDPGDGVDPVRAAIGDGPLLVEDCQHLYRRTVGGFEPLSSFLDLVAATDETVVTGWNRYAWTYLAAVRAVDDAFPTVVDVGPVSAQRLAELVLARHDDVPEYVLEEVESELFTTRTIELLGRSIPVPTLGTLREVDGPEPRDVVFERLAAVSRGNVGVAAAIWERRLGDTVRPSDVGPQGDDIDLDTETAFCLRIVLAKERLRRDELAAVVGDDLDRVLGRLRRDGLVAVDEGDVRLQPAAVPTAITGTERRRVL